MSSSEYSCAHIVHIRHILDPETHQSGVVLSPERAERNICSADGAFSPEKHCQGDFTNPSAQALDDCLEDLLDKIYLVIQQGGLGYGGGDNGYLQGGQAKLVASV